MRLLISLAVILALASTVEAGPFRRFSCPSCANGSCQQPTLAPVSAPVAAAPPAKGPACKPDCQCAVTGKCSCRPGGTGGVKCTCPNCICGKSVLKQSAPSGDCDSCDDCEATGMFGGNGPIRRFFRNVRENRPRIFGRRCCG